MERKIYISIILIFLLPLFLFGQSNRSIYQAYITGDMKKWKAAMDSIDAKPYKTNKERLDLINYYYGYIGWSIDMKKTDEAEDYIKKSEDLIKILENKRYDVYMLEAHKAALVGFEIGISPYKAPFIGPKSLDYATNSVELNPSNPFAHVQLGHIAFYTPPMFGGSKEDAMKHYHKALQLMTKEKKYTTNNWNYPNILATIVNAYIDLKKYELAKSYCIKALSIEPNFDWIKNKIYPQILKELNK